MSSWHERLRALAAGISILAQRSSGGEPDDDDPPYQGGDKGPDGEESRRIVEEAIRRLEEAEHEWSRSWEPDRPSEQ